MDSLRFFQSGLKLPGFRSVLNDFFGMFQVPAGETISLRQQMRRLRRPHIVHINIIRVAFDALTPAEREDAERELDVIVLRTRQIFDQIQIGIGRVQHWVINSAQAGGFGDIGSDGEADDICGHFSVDNDGIDAFVVLTYAGTTMGSSRSPGACDKDGKSSGIVVEVQQAGHELTATAFAHEIGHYLGYDSHSSDQNNLMSHSGARGLTESQGETMRCHCFVTDIPELQ